MSAIEVAGLRRTFRVRRTTVTAGDGIDFTGEAGEMRRCRPGPRWITSRP